MKLNLKMLAVSTALLGLLAAGAALPASAAGPLNAAAALSLPWSAAAVESVETGSYASTMTVGTQQQLSPVILPAGRTQCHGNFYVQRQYHRERDV